MEIDPDRAVAVGVILTELVLNARKHAYPNGNGPIRVRLQADRPQQVNSASRMTASACQRRPRWKAAARQVIIKAMVQKLGAEIRYDRRHMGTRAILVFDPTGSHAPRVEKANP